MKKALVIATAVLLMASMASAGQGPSAKKPRPLTDRDLDTITAGSASADNTGGVIVAGSSEATINVTGALSVDGTAQQDSRALNLVNSSDSAVANAANVWDGLLPNPTNTPVTSTGTVAANGLTDANSVADSAKTTLNVEQSNQVLQNAAHSARVKLYVRTEANVDETSKTSKEIID